MSDKLKYEPELNSGCWLWTGAPAAGGYGCVHINGKWHKAHRYSYRLHYGDFPDHLKVCHKCDTPACVNPAHLFLGTQADNVADMVSKGRQRNSPQYGDNNPISVLTSEKVSEIRFITNRKLFSQNDVARSYGVSPMTISRIVNNQTWVGITETWPVPSLESQREHMQ
jgi:hypothetical protein